MPATQPSAEHAVPAIIRLLRAHPPGSITLCMLGPLTNQAGATHQLIGVYDPQLTHTMAEVLGALGGNQNN